MAYPPATEKEDYQSRADMLKGLGFLLLGFGAGNSMPGGGLMLLLVFFVAAIVCLALSADYGTKAKYM